MKKTTTTTTNFTAVTIAVNTLLPHCFFSFPCKKIASLSRIHIPSSKYSTFIDNGSEDHQKILGRIDFRKLASDGFIVSDGVLGMDVCNQIKKEVHSLRESGHLKPAKVSLDKIRDDKIRGDNIMWLHQPSTNNNSSNFTNNSDLNTENNTTTNFDRSNDNGSDIQTQSKSIQPLVSLFSSIRYEINRTLFLNIKQCEFQISHYPQGQHYQRHSDVSKNKFSYFDYHRVVTGIYYLNTEWKPTDGGHLLIYPESQTNNQNYNDNNNNESSSNIESNNNNNENENDRERKEVQVIPPLGDRLVLFMSHLEHEVKTTNNDRYAVTCWYYSL
eukprot:TRINITY_DN4661_c0_g1_i1.p1 TRINITY_DN4661_c0_g1~~TRINITY_DN4661_c0_g1_i1.p1  ORF type:complete len:329 (-),score=86.64 TRINITY_DN4661_c0_g1_i1:25-1011(-)